MSMKIYEVRVEDRVYTVGKIEMEYLVLVFGDKAIVKEKDLQSNSGSDNIVGDENSFKCKDGQSGQEGPL